MENIFRRSPARGAPSTETVFHSRAKPVSVQHFGRRERVGKSSAVRMGSQLNRAAQPGARPRTAHQRHHFEEPGAYRSSGYGHSNGVNERSGFHTARLGHRPHGGFDRRRIEGRELVEGSRGGPDVL